MSKADKMFKVLGYTDFIDKWYGGYYAKEEYSKKGIEQIHFLNEWAHCDGERHITISFGYEEHDELIGIEVHLAIHEKLEELGWLDES